MTSNLLKLAQLAACNSNSQPQPQPQLGQPHHHNHNHHHHYHHPQLARHTTLGAVSLTPLILSSHIKTNSIILSLTCASPPSSSCLHQHDTSVNKVTLYNSTKWRNVEVTLSLVAHILNRLCVLAHQCLLKHRYHNLVVPQTQQEQEQQQTKHQNHVSSHNPVQRTDSSTTLHDQFADGECNPIAWSPPTSSIESDLIDSDDVHRRDGDCNGDGDDVQCSFVHADKCDDHMLVMSSDVDDDDDDVNGDGHGKVYGSSCTYSAGDENVSKHHVQDMFGSEWTDELFDLDVEYDEDDEEDGNDDGEIPPWFYDDGQGDDTALFHVHARPSQSLPPLKQTPVADVSNCTKKGVWSDHEHCSSGDQIQSPFCLTPVEFDVYSRFHHHQDKTMNELESERDQDLIWPRIDLSWLDDDDDVNFDKVEGVHPRAEYNPTLKIEPDQSLVGHYVQVLSTEKNAWRSGLITSTVNGCYIVAFVDGSIEEVDLKSSVWKRISC